MKVSLVHSACSAVIIGCLGLGLVACNTTKATVDTFAKFTSSTSPDSIFNQDGIVEQHQTLNLYAAVAYDNLQQDIARGYGEYLTSLGVLLKVPQDRGVEWNRFAQTRYSSLFPADAPRSEEAGTRLSRELAALRK